MASRLVDLYPLGSPVEILLAEQWRAGQIVRHDHPAVWVKTASGSLWFVTNRRRIRKRNLTGKLAKGGDEG